MDRNRESRERGKSTKLKFPSSEAKPPEDKNSGQPTKFITLLTDFGLSDIYVGVMKGVMACINPQVKVIDLCHDIAPQDIYAAAFLLAGSFGYFPPGTIHVVVVDPGVGGERSPLCVRAGQYFFIGPDNGVLSLACYRAGRPRIFVLENAEYFLKSRSQTFHGRDIFAPGAAHLSTGVPIELLGRRVRSMKRIRFRSPRAEQGLRVTGEIIHVDRFGNLITNIGEDAIRGVFPEENRKGLTITCAGHQVRGLSDTYSDAEHGAAVALIGSYGLLEIAVREGNASLMFGIARGGRVRIETPGGQTL